MKRSCELQPASETGKSEQDEEVRPTVLHDSAVYDVESNKSRLDECALSGVHPLDGSSIHDLQQDKEIPCIQSDKLECETSNVFCNGSSVEVQDSGACVSEISDKSDPSEGKALGQDKQIGSLAESVEAMMQAAIDDLPYQILRLSCNTTTTGPVLHKEANPLMYLDAASSMLPARQYSLGNPYSYSYYPQVAQERQSVLSPSLDELSSREEIFSTDVEDELMSGQVYVGGGKLTETSDAPSRSSKEHRDDDSCLVCAKTCACCGASLPDEDEIIIAERLNYLEKDVAHEMSDQDCECELEEVPSASESQKSSVRQNASKPVLPLCGRQAAKHRARRMQEGVELSELDLGHARGECGEQLHASAKPDKIKGKCPKGGQSRSSYMGKHSALTS